MNHGFDARRLACATVAMLAIVLPGCGGGGGASVEPVATPPVSPAGGDSGGTSGGTAGGATGGAPAPTTVAVTLKPPELAFSDTGVSVTDGVTSNGLWEVDSEVGWEYSLDMGATWIRGVGGQFVVTGDGAKTIWVRARDDFGNTSEIVRVNCVLDTTAPGAPMASPTTQGTTRVLRVSGIEPGARWEYSADDRQTWSPGAGPGLAVLGNGLAAVWLRQVDLAGNASAPQAVALDPSANDAWHEASGDPMQPSVLTVGEARTLLLHGSVVRADADYVRWDIPAGHRIASVRLVRYVSDDPIAFYAIQRAAVFDAGIDVSRMLVHGHMGPGDLSRDVLAGVPPGSRGEGPMTLWFQQTGPVPTVYAIELVLEPAS
jgi:hypothetical protein